MTHNEEVYLFWWAFSFGFSIGALFTFFAAAIYEKYKEENRRDVSC